MEFREWMSISEQPTFVSDAFDGFLSIVSESYSLTESSGPQPISIQAEFVLCEADAPWESEKWLDKNPKIKYTDIGVKDFKKAGKPVVFDTFLINLLPARQSGINLCICATKECAKTCLHTAGAVQFLTAKTVARLRKTWFIALDRHKAFDQIASQIAAKKKKIDDYNKKSKTDFKQLAIRLNGTSDLIWRVFTGSGGKNIFDMFPEVLFYDYSKNAEEMESFIKGEVSDKEGNVVGKFPPNYHLTFSYGSPENTKTYNKTLEGGENLAVPFGPGKTASLDYMVFPKSMEDLLRNIYFPDFAKTPQQRKEYKQSILDQIAKEGNFVSSGELASLAGQTLLPGIFMCHEVIDGDDYDARFLDDYLTPHRNLPNDPTRPQPEIDVDYSARMKKRHGFVVGLTAKGDLSFSAYKGKKGWDESHTGFMVGPNDTNLNSPCEPMLNQPSKAPFLKMKTEVYKKVAKAIMTVRNFDARHVHAHDADENGNPPRTHVFRHKGEKGSTQTYRTAKGRATQEMNELIGIIHDIMAGKQTSGVDIKKHRDVVDAAAKLRQYLLKPETITLLNDPEFVSQARRIGMDVSFESLAKLADIKREREPNEPQITLIPSSTLRMLGSKRT